MNVKSFLTRLFLTVTISSSLATIPPLLDNRVNVQAQVLSSVAPADWFEQIPAAVPIARYSHATAFDSRRGIDVLFRGINANRFMNDTTTLTSSTWTLRLPPDAPPERAFYAMAYDSTRNVTVMFGGLSRASANLNDTWELSGSTWTKRTPAHVPSPRYEHSMAYDAARQQVVLFGGDNPNRAGETWIWDGLDWTLKSPGMNPPARYGTRLVYDAAREVVVMYGGLSNVFGVLNDTWEWDGSNWIEKHPLSNPGGRWDHSMAYDTARSKVVLIGGLGRNDNQTWEYDGNDWVNYNPVVAPALASNIAMTYDQTIHRIVLLAYEPATINAINRVWQWDGVTWTDRTPTSGPLVRTGATLVFDTARAKSILFGGESALSDDSKQLKDTWEWNGVSGVWTQTISPKNPPASATAIAYDNARREIVLFGGSTATAGGSHATNETWVLGDNDTQWTQRFPQHQPPARLNHSLVYDSGRSVVVLFGGNGNNTAAFNDTWEWNGLDWIQKQPANSPPPRDGAGIAYDSDRGVIVMFGGRGNTLLGDTWEYDGTNWVQRFPEYSPPTRNSAGMVYDSRRHKIILFGDYSTNSNETWEWDGTDWTLRTLPLSPSGRGLQGMAFDASRGVTVLFGGVGPGYLSDTWEYDGNTWTLIAPAISPGPRYTGHMAYNPSRRAVVIVGGGIPTGLMDDTWEYRSTNTPPAVDAGGPYSVNEGGSVTVTASGNDPDGDALAYTWDLDNNDTFETPGQTVTFSAMGLGAPSTRIIKVQATDSGGLSATDEAKVNVGYNFGGFFQPVDNFPTWNELKAGRAVSVRFSLNGYKGLNIFEVGYPKAQVIACTSTDPVDGIEETVTAGASGLSYDASTDQYTYVWKTDKAWITPPCRQLVIKFNDGTFQRANFKFIK